MKKLFVLCITFLSHILSGTSDTSASDPQTDEHKIERKKAATALLELHNLYISTGEAKKPMVISLPDMAKMADLSEERTASVFLEFKEEGLIQMEKSGILILKRSKLKKIARQSILTR